jgi:hypothetical protein
MNASDHRFLVELGPNEEPEVERSMLADYPRASQIIWKA